MLRLLTFFINLGLAIAFSIIVALIYMGDQLPSVKSLRDIQLQTPLRVYTLDGKLISQFGEKRRIPVAMKDVPQTLLDAFIATEDRRFYDHGGVDLRGLIRAAHHVISERNKGQGGSTITMQLARNMFLSSQKTYIRKVNEILLALKIEHEFTKDEIMELYLNKIYLGQRAYGVASAAEVYYGKTLNELSLGQMAMIAGLPKAPSTLNPISSPTRAKERRKHVLERMLDQGFITQAQFAAADAEPIVARYHGPEVDVRAPYVAEMVRQAMYEKLGEEAYEMGLKVYTTLDSHMQVAANTALENGLLSFDRHEAYRGPLGKINLSQVRDHSALLDKLNQFAQTAPFTVGVVVSLYDQEARVLLKDGTMITLPWSGMSWARRGGSASDIFQAGSVIQLVKNESEWTLAQSPTVSGALVALRPQDGAILALTGGFDFYSNNFNLVTQAQRQPGSNIKPFIYSAALEHGYTTATLINDAPIVFKDPSQEGLWRPENDNKEFNGPMRLRMGLVKSRNLVSIRILEGVGIPETIDYLQRFGFQPSSMPLGLSLALGTNIVTPLQLATAYAVFANGGYLVQPYFIDHITDNDDQMIEYAVPAFACAPCTPEDIAPYFHHKLSAIHSAKKVISDENAFLITDMLQDAIKRGTGKAAAVLNRPDLAGKTGTTNEFRDGWFSGYTTDIVATTWIGFDNNDSLGQYASQSTLPTWINFMRVALKDTRVHTLPQPDDIVMVPIDPKSGLLARPGQKNAEMEYFTMDTVPTLEATEQSTAPGTSDENGTPSSPESLF
jgi:penicillin-binding protein 1A